jgi:phage baseplate assembly protein W
MSNNATLYTKVTVPTKSTATTVKSKMYRGFSTVSTSTNNFALYDFELIKQDLLNSFYIRQGERLMNPEYGCIIWELLFEPLTPQIQDLLVQNVNAIINADPRVQASNVLITQYESGIQIQLTLTYVQYNLQESLQLQFDQANGLSSNSITV